MAFRRWEKLARKGDLRQNNVNLLKNFLLGFVYLRISFFIHTLGIYGLVASIGGYILTDEQCIGYNI